MAQAHHPQRAATAAAPFRPAQVDQRLRITSYNVCYTKLLRIDQYPDLIIALRLKVNVEIAFGHTLGCHCQFLDRYRNAAGEVESEPGSKEDDDQGNQQQKNQVPGLDASFV